jgi:uncharacterized protein (DUF2252 family)
MAADLATTPHSGLRVQLCGDAHLSNFGFYASPERHLVFDLNDFDETLPGSWGLSAVRAEDIVDQAVTVIRSTVQQESPHVRAVPGLPDLIDSLAARIGAS